MKRKTKDIISVWTTILLVAANLIFFNIIISSFNKVRIDLTQYREHSLSPHTIKVLNALPDRVEILGVFSTNTHRLLKPLIPRLRDLLENYASQSNGKVTVELMNPSSDKKIRHLYEEYGIKPFPVPLESKYKKEVKSIYFNLIIKYGDQTVKYVLDDMIDISETAGDLTVKLKDMELLITRGIRKATTSFNSIDSAMASVSEPISVTYYKLPVKFLKNIDDKKKKELDGAIAKLKKAVKKYSELNKNAITFKEVDASTEEKLFTVEVSFLKKTVQFPLFFQLGDVSRSDVSENLEAALKRVLPGFTQTIGLVSPLSDFDPQMARMGRQPPPSEFAVLENLMKGEYEVKQIDLSSGTPPLDVETLILLRPENYTENQLYALDQYIMLGGRVIMFMDSSKLDLKALGAGKLAVKPISSGMENLLSSYGVKLSTEILADSSNFPYPLPREIQRGLVVVDEVPYPYFVKIKSTGSHSAVANLAELYFLWPSHITVEKKKGITSVPILKSSANSWTESIPGSGLDVTPNPTQKSNSKPKSGEKILALALSGSFTSIFKDKPNPLEKVNKDTQKTDNTKKDSKSGSLVKKDTPQPKKDKSPNTRIIIVADSDIISEVGMKILENRFQFSLKFLQNIIEWIQSDDEDFKTSAKGLPRPLQEISDSQKSFIQHIIWITSLIILWAVFLVITIYRRRKS
ncbi:MAG: Gldg family protein [Deltaproteobacteria bacterium]|nr:Gldg family protein [Deltaproteobacteria bacterium]